MLADKTSDGKFKIELDVYSQKILIQRVYLDKNMTVKKVDSRKWNLCLMSFKNLDKTIEYFLKKGNKCGHLGNRDYLKN